MNSSAQGPPARGARWSSAPAPTSVLSPLAFGVALLATLPPSVAARPRRRLRRPSPSDAARLDAVLAGASVYRPLTRRYCCRSPGPVARRRRRRTPADGAHLAPPHPGHEEEPRDDRVEARPRSRATSPDSTPRPVAGGEDGGQIRRPAAALAGGPPCSQRGPGRCVPRPGSAHGRGGPGSTPRPPPGEASWVQKTPTCRLLQKTSSGFCSRLPPVYLPFTSRFR